MPLKLAAQEEGVESNSFGKGHSNNGLDENLTGSARIAANSFNSFHTDHAHTNSGGGTTDCALETMVQVTFNSGEYFDHFSCGLRLWFNEFLVARHAVRIGYLWHRSQRERLVSMFCFVSVITDQTNIDSGQQRENERLNESNE